MSEGRPMRPRAAGLVPASLLLLACPERPGPGPQGPSIGPPTPTAPQAPPTRADEPAPPREPPRLLTDPGSGVSMVWSGAAADAVVAGAELVVLEPDARHLDAFDWSRGEARWRIELPTSGAAELYSLGDRVLVHDRDHATVVEAARGRVLGRHDAPAGRTWPYVHGVVRRHDACAWEGPCGIQILDCADGAPLGPYLASSELHLYDSSDDPTEHSTSCSPEPRLLGRRGGTVVLVAAVPPTDGADPSTGPGPGLLGLDPHGRPRWQQPLPSDLAPAGMTSDGSCWILDEDTPALLALDCESGVTRWQRPLGPGRLRAHGLDESIVIARDHGNRWRLSAYATDDGEPTWSVRLAKREHYVLPGTPLPEAHTTGKRRVYGLVDPSRGQVAGELVAGRDEELWRDPSGGFVLTGPQLRELDGDGRLTRQRPFAGAHVHMVLAGHLVAHDGDTLEIYDREALRERARVEGRMVIETSPLPDDRLLLRRPGEDGVALVLGLDPPERYRGIEGEPAASRASSTARRIHRPSSASSSP
ncbi:MAG: PQQ-binding-like beta-propeller repeat protein [Myxococcales bacterium]|nr:PQQ-binding-like beta-propeller repeat protein [Myxococcales bacterium]